MSAFENWYIQEDVLCNDYYSEEDAKQRWKAALNWVLSLSNNSMCGEHLEIINNQIIEEINDV